MEYKSLWDHERAKLRPVVAVPSQSRLSSLPLSELAILKLTLIPLC